MFWDIIVRVQHRKSGEIWDIKISNTEYKIQNTKYSSALTILCYKILLGRCSAWKEGIQKYKIQNKAVCWQYVVRYYWQRVQRMKSGDIDILNTKYKIQNMTLRWQYVVIWYCESAAQRRKSGDIEIQNKQACKLQATLVRNYNPLTRSQGWSVELLA